MGRLQITQTLTSSSLLGGEDEATSQECGRTRGPPQAICLDRTLVGKEHLPARRSLTERTACYLVAIGKDDR
jgi:hypothetical protein